MNFAAAMSRMIPTLRDIAGQSVIHRRRDEPDEWITAGVQAQDGEDFEELGSRYTRSRLLITVVRGDLVATLDTRSRFVVGGLEYDVVTLAPDGDAVVAGCERIDRILAGDLHR